MDAATYPNPKVIEFIEANVIPVQLKHDAQPMARDYNVKWTPNLLIVDGDGKEHHRIIGFLPPVELICSLLLGIGKAHFNRNELEAAIAAFDRVLAEYPYASAAPEAVFFRGVALYKSTHVSQHLKDAYQKLQTHYHGSEWAWRAYPYWLLP
jgi:hypothetical protein